MSIERRFIEPRDVRRTQRKNDSNAPCPDQQSDRAARGGKKNAFRQQLANDAAPSRAQSGAHSHFLPPRGRTAEQQVRYIDAGDEQDEADRPEQYEQNRTRLARDLTRQGTQMNSPTFMIEGRHLRLMARDGAYFGLRLSERYFPLDPAYGNVIAYDATLPVLSAFRVWKPDVGLRRQAVSRRHLRAAWEIESRRHHPDNRAPSPVYSDKLADDVRLAAEAAPPQVVADDRHFVLARSLLVHGEHSPKQRLRSQQGEEIGRHLNASHPLRITPFGEICEAWPDRSDLFERFRISSPFWQIDRGRRQFVKAQIERRMIRPQHHNPVWIVKGQRLEQHRVDDAENRRVRADSERQREDGDQREAGSFQQHSRAMT